MNYAVVIVAGVFVIALSWWYISGRHYYTGPRTRAHVENGVIVNDESGTDEQVKAVGPV